MLPSVRFSLFEIETWWDGATGGLLQPFLRRNGGGEMESQLQPTEVRSLRKKSGSLSCREFQGSEVFFFFGCFCRWGSRVSWKKGLSARKVARLLQDIITKG